MFDPTFTQNAKGRPQWYEISRHYSLLNFFML